MLTLDMLRANSVFSALTQEQLEAIAAMSKNDEEVTIGRRIGELHGSYDNDIFSVTAVAKNDGEKSYDYLKRVLNDYKSKASDREQLKNKLRESEQKVQDLQKQVDGGNAEISKQLKDEKDLTASLRKQLDAKTAALTEAEKSYNEKLLDYRVNAAFDTVFGGLTFRQDITEPVKEAMKLAAKNEVKSKGSLSFDEARNELVLRNANGEIVRNQANNMNPYTLEELVKETSIKDILQQQKVGGGTKPPTGGSVNVDNLLDLSSAKTQADADDIISSHLSAKGFNIESPEYWEQFTQLRNDNNVASLPMQ